jgi:O-acetyl-ADP-ribose deacetylase (regulator of RNase III)
MGSGVITNAHDVTVKRVQGDIARQLEVGAIVNAANAQLRIGGGMAGAIHCAAGPGLHWNVGRRSRGA